MSDNATGIKAMYAKLQKMDADYQKPKESYTKPWHRFTLKKEKDKK